VISNIQASRVLGSLRSVLEDCLSSDVREVVRAAAQRMCIEGYRLPNTPLDEDGEARAVFKTFGLDRLTSVVQSPINIRYRELLFAFNIDRSFGDISWHHVLGEGYDSFAATAVKLTLNPSGNRDVMCLELFSAWEDVPELIATHLGLSRAICNGKTKKVKKPTHWYIFDSNLAREMPALCRFMKKLNHVRNHSPVAHSKNSDDDLRNIPISYNKFREVLLMLPDALGEISAKFPQSTSS
jgi:hypothetical protein